ncbi:DUF1801 domain-containing protein [Plastorhodobacter daqingensis]|uniref:DUF1801 domain-containing protein n=1 Tax=Plastorhodobacter daqingensis TaxID=1387281 RepID=A0ABW2UQX8_9RHOB
MARTGNTSKEGKASSGARLLAGGNPQIPKGEGDGPVRAYIAAMPGWKSAIGRAIDETIAKEVPHARKAVKWNSPFYGAADEAMGWFLSLHCFNHYVKVTFFRGASLVPPPPGKSKYPEVRYLDIREDSFDESRFQDWVRQAAALPGEKL